MAEVTSAARAAAAAEHADELPQVCLEVGPGSARPALYTVTDAGFLIGTVPGCDLRVSGGDWAAVLALVTRSAGGASVRKLSPTQPLLVNGQAVATAALATAITSRSAPSNWPCAFSPPRPLRLATLRRSVR